MFQESAKQHNEDIVKGIKTAAENDLMKEVEEARSDFNYHDWINFYLHIKQNALNQVRLVIKLTGLTVIKTC